MGFYLRHSIGFFLQLAPSVYLCLIPFGKGAFQIPKKRIYAGYTAVCALLSLFFPVFLKSSLFTSLLNVDVRANLYMLLAVILFVTSLFFCIREATMKKVMVIFLALIYALTQYIIVNLIGSFLPRELVTEVYSESYFILFAVSTAIMFPFCAVTFHRVLGNYIREIDSRNMRKEFNIVTGVSLAYVAVLLVYASGSAQASANTGGL
ncbi:MAG: hypothetical protein LUH58_03520 [Lachnospiraceae bacterium]|nr:hypothetical protein [Lachnospiraceae bacterium]